MRLDDPDLVTLIDLWLRMAIADLRLKLLPKSWNRIWIFGRGKPNSSANSAPIEAEVARIRSLAARAAGRPIVFNMSCLRQALAVKGWLGSHRGVEGRIRFGAEKKAADESAAFHAWFEIEGSDKPETSFRTFE